MLKCLGLPSLEQDYTILLAKEVATLSCSQNLSAVPGFCQLPKNTFFIDL